MRTAAFYLCSPEDGVESHWGLSGFKMLPGVCCSGCIVGHCVHPGPRQQPHMKPSTRMFGVQSLGQELGGGLWGHRCGTRVWGHQLPGWPFSDLLLQRTF